MELIAGHHGLTAPTIPRGSVGADAGPKTHVVVRDLEPGEAFSSSCPGVTIGFLYCTIWNT